MTSERLDSILHQLDAETRRLGNTWRLTVGGRPLLAVTDEHADRMRVMAFVTLVASVPAEDRLRMLQANFDSALDARYAIGHGTLWSVFLHPLGSLTEEDLLSGISQVGSLVDTYGTSFSSGTLRFQGGDTPIDPPSPSGESDPGHGSSQDL